MTRKLTRSSNLNSMLAKHCLGVISLLDELKKLCDLQATVHLDGEYPLAIEDTEKTCVGPFNVSGEWFQEIIARRKGEIISQLSQRGCDFRCFEEKDSDIKTEYESPESETMDKFHISVIEAQGHE